MHRPGDDDWPIVVPAVVGGASVVVAVAAALQRDSAWFLVPALLGGIWCPLQFVTRVPPLVAAVAVHVAVAWFVFGERVHADVSPFLLVCLASWTTATTSVRVAAGVVATSVALPVVAQATTEFDSAFVWGLGIVFGSVAALALRTQLDLVAALREAQAGVAQQAALEERRRIARELHDVIAHSLSVTMLHLTAARLALDADVEEARAALLDAERLGRQSLADVRRTVGVLGAGDGAGGAAPAQPGATDVVALVDEYRSGGAAVELTTTGDLAAVDPVTGLVVYRAVQECLANATRHAPGAPVSVTVAVDGDGVGVEVENPVAGGAAPTRDGGAGMGLDGMRARAEAVGGTVAVDGGGAVWRVTLALPAVVAAS